MNWGLLWNWPQALQGSTLVMDQIQSTIVEEQSHCTYKWQRAIVRYDVNSYYKCDVYDKKTFGG